MAKWVAILEDDASRVAAVRAVLPQALASVLPAFDAAVFDNVPDMIDWLEANLADTALTDTALICLDHDLGANRVRDGAPFDPGIGRDVADFLAMCPARCPVVVHSSNTPAVPGMLRALRESGWVSSAVMPSDDLRWVREAWREELEWLAGRGMILA
jgi:hypothetical protein